MAILLEQGGAPTFKKRDYLDQYPISNIHYGSRTQR